MPNLYLIGQASLDLSTLLYTIFFLPQLFHNAKRRRLSRLRGQALPSVSWALHICYITGTAADLLYGFGEGMPWQYRLVSLSFLTALIVQHIQLRPIERDKQKILAYIKLSLCCLSITLIAILLLLCHAKPKVLLVAGFISTGGVWLAFLPQLIRNARLKDGRALSQGFILLTLLTAALDMLSAICLHWPLPSLIGPPIIFITHGVALWQYHTLKPVIVSSKLSAA